MLVVSIDTSALAFVASYPEGGEAYRLSWNWARECGALFDARLLRVAVDPDGAVVWDVPWGDGPVPGHLRCVAAGGTFDAGRPERGWTLSERWKFLAWSPLTASDVDGECVWVLANGVEIARGPLFPRPVEAAAVLAGLTLIPVG